MNIFAAHISELIVAITAIISTTVGALLTHLFEMRKAHFGMRSYPLHFFLSNASKHV
jgi:hypothetical protein